MNDIAVKYKIVNAYDEIVRQNVRLLMEDSDMCKCEKCYLDVCALVLNNGYTRFVTTREGELLSKLPEMSHNYRVDMTVTILDAMNTVAKFPQH